MRKTNRNKPVSGKRHKLLYALLLALLLPPLSSPVHAVSYSNEYRQLAFFYKPSSDTTTDVLAKKFDNFILTKGDEKYRDTLKAKGVDSPILQYLRFDAIQDPGSCTKQPLRNQVADRPGDFCSISNNHKDWFLLDTNGKRMYFPDGYVMMDPGNSGWRSFFLDRAKLGQTQLGWYGVFLDNIEGSLVKRRQYGQMPAKYTSDSAYQSAINGFLSYLYNGYYKGAGRPLMGNIISLKPTSVWFTYLNNMDGALCEAWGTGWGTSGWRSESDWLENLNRIEQTQSKGKRAFLIAQGAKSNTSRQQFGYASFLLIDNGRAFFRYGLANSYQQAWLYSNYDLDLGTPLGNKYKTGSDYCRDFTKAKVCVNPSAHTSKITLK